MIHASKKQTYAALAICWPGRQTLTFLLLLISLLGGLLGCSAPDPDVVPANTGETASYRIDGKAYTDNSPGFLGGTGYFSLYSVVAVSSSINSPGYIIRLDVYNPKVGTFTAQSNALTGSIGYFTSLTDVLSYDISTRTGGTVSFTRYDSAGFAEGTFSFVGRTATGKTVNVTDGTFKVKLD